MTGTAAARAAIAAFAEVAGRRPRILIAGGAPGGLIGSLADLGFDVDVAAEIADVAGVAGIARQAVDADVHVVAVPAELVDGLWAALDALGGAEVTVVVHGPGPAEIAPPMVFLDDGGAVPTDVENLLLGITQQR